MTFQISGLRFAVETPFIPTVSDSFLPFMCDDAKPDWTISVSQTESLPNAEDRVFENGFQAICRDGEGFVRYLRSAPNSENFLGCVRLDLPRSRVLVQYKTENERSLTDLRSLVSRAALEEILMLNARLVFHAALIETQFGGILFSGPSGIGKSTQARIWCEFENSTLINGDRPILHRSEGKWMGWGSPYAGSSNCFTNLCTPIRAVVFLEQGKQCKIERIRLADGFRKLYAQTMVNTWNPQFVESACEMLTLLAAEVPMYHLICTPDRGAVEMLKTKLQEGVD